MASMKYCGKHNQVRFLKKPEESTGFAEIVDFLKGSYIRYALTHNPTIHDSLVKQFWQTATASTLADGTLELRVTIDTLEYTITKASARSKLQLADALGIFMLPNTEIFEGMGNMGPKSGGWDQFGSNLATALICLSTGRIYNFSKLIFDGMVANLKSKTKFLMYPRFLQMILEIQTENKHPYLAIVLTKKIFGNMKRGFRGVPRPLLPTMLPVVAIDQSAGPADLAEDQPSSSAPLPSSSHPPVISATLASEPTPVAEPTTHHPSPSPEPDDEQTEHIFEQPSPEHQPLSPRQETNYDSRRLTVPGSQFDHKVKKLESILKRRHVVLTDSEDEEPEDQRRIILPDQEDKSEVFKTPTQSKTSGEEDISPTTLEAAKILSKVASQKSKSVDKGKRYKRRKESKGKDISTGFEDISTGCFEKANTGGLRVSTGSGPVSSAKGQREGKAPMIVPHQRRVQREVKLQAQEEAENARKAEQQRQDALIAKRVQEEFDKCVEKVEKFIPMNSKLEASKLKRTGINLQAEVFKKQKITNVPDVTKDESVKREEEFKVQQPILRYNIRKYLARKGLQKNKSESARSDTEEDVEAYMDERVDEPSSEEFQMGLIPQGSAPAKIVKWQILKTGKKGAYQIIREDHTDIVYVNFQGLLNNLTRDDLKELYRLMMLKYEDSRPEEEYERVLWGDLKTMFDPPSIEDAVWSLTHQQKVPSWGYFHSCDVHCLTLEAAHIYLLTEVKYPLPSRVCQAMLEKKLIGDRKDEIDVKSAFLYGKIEEEVYVCQPSGFEDPDFLDRVYKVEKALYGLHQAPRAWYETLSTYLLDNGFQRGKIDKTLFIRMEKGDILLVQVYVDDIIFSSIKKSLCTEFEKIMHKKFQMSSMGELTFFLGLQVKQKEDGIFISQDKYVTKILKKFGLIDVKTVSTHMETQKPLLKDKDGEEVDVHLYRSMIGSLMYLTSSRPNIMFAVCACARYQVNPKVSHLHAVKRIFRYLKGQPKLGLWYPKDSPFDLLAYTDSDYVGASLNRKSTIGGCQFLGSRLISWQCMKQTVVANSIIEAEYVAASSCYGQVLWIQNQLLDYGYNFMHTKIFIDNNSTICIIKNSVFHSKTKHIEIRHHFIRDCNDKKLIQIDKIHTDKNVAYLLTKAFDVSRFEYLIASIGMLNL
ncbi:putative ribonuclease H-like domain-containing protein [Tanacetum coccineum]